MSSHPVSTCNYPNVSSFKQSLVASFIKDELRLVGYSWVDFGLSLKPHDASANPPLKKNSHWNFFILACGPHIVKMCEITIKNQYHDKVYKKYRKIKFLKKSVNSTISLNHAANQEFQVVLGFINKRRIPILAFFPQVSALVLHFKLHSTS